MGRMKELYTQILECDTCLGQGWQFFGNETDYDVEACDCNPLGFFQENKQMSEIAGMWICDNCDTLAIVSVETDTILVTQCKCVTNERETNV